MPYRTSLVLFFCLTGVLFAQSRYATLDSALREAQIIYLGEQTHLDGATFDAKVALIRHFHEDLGFTVLAFEDDPFALGRAGSDRRLNQLMPLWSRTTAVRQLAQYLKARPGLHVAGFDSQLTTRYTRDSLAVQVRELLPELPEPDELLLRELVNRVARSDSFTDEDLRRADRLEKTLDRLLNRRLRGGTERSFWRIITESLVHAVRISVAEEAGRTEPVQNARDRQMARNLLHLTRQYPGEKIICWGASYHFAKDLRTLQVEDSVTLRALRQLNTWAGKDSLPLLDLRELSRGRPMAAVFDSLSELPTFSLAFTAGGGYIHYNFPDEDTVRFTLPPPVPGSWEALLGKVPQHERGEAVFLPLSPQDTNLRYLSALGYLPLLANWARAFDGLYHLPSMYPVSYTPAAPPDTLAPDRQLQGGRVVDAATGAPIPYAYIYPTGEAGGAVVSNLEGYFRGSRLGDSVRVTAIGYADLVAPTGVARFALDARTYQMKEVVVRTARIDPLTLIQAAVHAIPFNYPQTPSLSRLLWRDVLGDSSRADTVDAILRIHDRIGYRAVGWERVLNGKTARIDSIYNRDTTRRELRWDVHAPIDFFGHDPLLTNTNPLNPARFRYYDYRLIGTQDFAGRKVFVIAFTNRRPNAHTAGTTHLAEHEGTLYLTSDDFALVRYEERFRQRPFVRKVRSNRRTGDTRTVNNSYRRIFQYSRQQGRYVLSYARHTADRKIITATEQRVVQEVKALYLLDWQPEIIEPLDYPLMKLDRQPLLPRHAQWDSNQSFACFR